jgi:RNA polymerase sigma-54 factor
MKQTLQLKLSQHLTLTPQLQQSIRLLQLSTLELNQELERFLAENPLLEREEGDGDEFGPPAHVNGSEPPAPTEASEQRTEVPEDAPVDTEPSPDTDWSLEGGGSGAVRDGDEESDYPQVAAVSTSLREYLLQQVSVTNLPERDRTLVTLLIDALNDDGYLSQPLEEIAAMFPPDLGVELDELAIALKHLQNFDPTGVGARSPAECLELQLLALDAATPGRECALAIVREHIVLLAARDFAKLKKNLVCDDAQLRTAQKLIQSLNPRPGAEYAPLDTRYVVADVIVKKAKNVWLAALNPDAMPKLRINRIYADILQSSRNAGGSQLASQLQEARWLIKNVQQRFETIQRVSQAIVDRQRHFFEHGEVAMRPLVLREIADVLDLHESTVSRVTTQKYMSTPRGIFELKYFFGSHVATETGGACSATAIRALIKQLVAAEDGKKPLSDSKISQILGQQGIVVARRTIAKYRESLHIPPVNLRKSL